MLSDLTKSDEWQHLIKAAAFRQTQSIDADIALPDPITVGPVRADFSSHLCSSADLQALFQLAERQDLSGWCRKMAAGERINNTEDRAVRHMDLRNHQVPDVEVELNKLYSLASHIRSSGRFRHVVNIGIGGSDLGPRMIVRALSDLYPDQPVSTHFVANVDPLDFSSAVRGLNPKETLFIICSKTMTTMETMANAQLAMSWLQEGGVPKETAGEHLVGVSTNHAAMDDLGIPQEARLTFWDWVGGRYSLWSVIGASIAIGYGTDVFEALLKGAHMMDEHFLTAPMQENIPVISALLGVWYRNFMGAGAYAVHAYAQPLELFVPYLQQLDMESNGKMVDRDGAFVDYDTAPVVFGQVGTNGQHAFFQMLHQGTDMIPSEFIAFQTPLIGADQHRLLLANLQAQVKALAYGRVNEAEPHRHFSGNRPATVMMLESLNPESLGALIAYYEHRVFVQGVIWGINSFDQWGVELGKALTKEVLALD